MSDLSIGYTLGKLLEGINLNRLTECAEIERGLSTMLFSFRKEKWMVDAIRIVVEKADKASLQKWRGDRNCAVLTIDVKNALPSTSANLSLRQASLSWASQKTSS